MRCLQPDSGKHTLTQYVQHAIKQLREGSMIKHQMLYGIFYEIINFKYFVTKMREILVPINIMRQKFKSVAIRQWGI